MEGIREFTNKACFDIKVILTVRSGEKPGCVANREEFCLRRNECKAIAFGNKCNPFLDGIRVCPADNYFCTETCVAVLKIGDPIDKMLNKHHHITFLSAGECLVISNYKG